MSLTPKQKRFVEEYLVDLNATQAAIRSGYSQKTARAIGQENLTKPDISDAIAEAEAARSERTQITADRVLEEYARIGFADIRKAVRWGRNPGDETSENADRNGLGIYPVSLIPSEEIDDDTALAVSEVSLTQTGLKIKMHDKKSALDSIGKHLGMFVDKHEHSGPNGAPINVVSGVPRGDGDN
ncbi:MAG: terminase small subunit [Pseudomonadota bacterium]